MGGADEQHCSTNLVLGSRDVLDHLIAVGGMGQVWKATDLVLERSVAVKLIRTDLLDSEVFRRRFRAEARLAAAVSHPGIAHVYDYAEDSLDGRRVAFLVMEFIDGQPLSHRLAQRDRPNLGEVVSILHQTCQTLGAAHHVGIVHRDIKPGNLLITADGGVKVTDFGSRVDSGRRDGPERGRPRGRRHRRAAQRADRPWLDRDHHARRRHHRRRHDRPVTDPVADDPGTGGGNGPDKDKAMGRGNGRNRA